MITIPALSLWRAAREMRAIQVAGVPRPAHAVPRTAVSMGAIALAGVLLAGNALGVVSAATAPGVYVMALLLLLLSSGILFVALLFSRLVRDGA